MSDDLKQKCKNMTGCNAVEDRKQGQGLQQESNTNFVVGVNAELCCDIGGAGEQQGQHAAAVFAHAEQHNDECHEATPFPWLHLFFKQAGFSTAHFHNIRHT